MEFTERMERGRDAAAAKRHRGISTGKSAKGWNAKPRYDEQGTWDATRYVVRLKWELARDEALQTYASLMFPERYEDLPF